MRIIPKQTKVTIEFFKNIDLFDVIVGMTGTALALTALSSNLPFNVYIGGVFAVITVMLILPIDDIKGYHLLLQLLKYLSRPKVFAENNSMLDANVEGQKKNTIPPVSTISGFTGIAENAIEYGGKYYAKVIEVDSVEFRFFSAFRQNNIIDKVVGGIIRALTSEQTMLFVKIDRPIIYDKYIENEFEKIDQLKESYLNALIEEDEFTTRAEIVFDRISDIQRLNFDEKVYRPFHYIVIIDKNLNMLTEIAQGITEQLTQGDLPVRLLDNKELAKFLKYNFTADFDEREIENLEPSQYMDWILPKRIEFTSRTTIFDDLVTHNLRVVNYPTVVSNAWGHRLFNIPDTKVVMKLQAIDRNRAVRNIDRSIDELRGQEASTGKTSKLIELSNHIDTLTELLTLLQNDNEGLYDVSLTVTVMDYNNESSAVKGGINTKKRVRRMLAEESFKTNDMFLQQFEGYSSSVIGASNPMRKRSRSIHSTSIAAAFPYVYSSIADAGGFNIGTSSNVPVFINFFVRNRERVNSNMVIIGKSGGGKSFATKTILTHLAAEDSKIFILDPENEYSILAKNLQGKIIDVGTASQGRMNPFHIITSLSDEEGDSDEASMGFSAHLQFLEEFFKQILPGIASEPLEFLNNLVVRMYMDKGIDEFTDFATMKPEDFPTFDDLYDRILTEYQAFDSDYNKNLLRTLLNYVSKFSAGGRNSNLWNGAASISTKENFIVFNFQSLLANKNNTIANAQMLLVLKWLDNEIIKNRDYNMKYNAARKVVIVIDEAHVFIDEKFPIALDFMHQLAKRIRKYNGMQIVITQNIKDFVGTEELTRKSTAIINACQYSMIFPLAPNDMNDLCRLYEKAGAINETEQEEIVNNGRGRAFMITSPSSRTSVNIIATDAMQRMFQ